MSVNSNTVRIGIAGTSRGGGFIEGLAALGGRAQLVAAFDPDPIALARFCAENQVETACRSFEELLEHVDAVVLSSPQHQHAPQAVMALAHGIHVLSEVPAVVSGEQASELLAAVRASSAHYAMAENYCYTRPNLIVRELVRAGLFGEIHFGEGEYIHDLTSLLHKADGSKTWRHFWQVNRNGMTYPTHSVGPLLHWFDDRIVAISSTGTGHHSHPELELEDTVVSVARTAKGKLLRLRLDLVSPRPHLMDYYSLQGTKGAYESSRRHDQPAMISLEGSPRAADGTQGWQPIDDFAEEFLPAKYRADNTQAGHWGADLWPIRDFVQSIIDDVRPEIDVYRALDMTLPAFASETSINQGGAWVTVPNPRFLTAGIGVNPGRESPLA